MSGNDDKIMTRFCQVMTRFCAVATWATPGFATPVSGRGEGVDTARMTRWTLFRCRRCAVFRSCRISHRRPVAAAALGRALLAATLLAAMSLACSNRAPEPTPGPGPGVPRSRLATEIAEAGPSETERAASRYYEGYLSETLRGDIVGARAAYDAVISESGAQAPIIAARAALRVAELEILAGRPRQAFEFTARAWVLGADNPDIVERADRLQARLGGLRSDPGEVRGPPIGTGLVDVPDQAAEEFARAEELLRAYHRKRLEPRLEQLQAGVRSKENAMDAAVRSYRAVLALTGDQPAVVVAAEFRTASLYHDLALSLMFELPPELEPGARERLRRSLQASAMSYLRKALLAYQRSVAAAGQLPPGQSSESIQRWAIAADVGLRAVSDLLGDRK